MHDTFAFIRLRGRGWHWQSVYDAASQALAPASVWGMFEGLFGIGSNELIVVTVGGGDAIAASIQTLAALDAIVETESLTLLPTVRPTTSEPMTREGLYVFRFLDIAHADVETAAALSNTAWETLENSDRFQAEPQALFCQRDRTAERGQMLLVTWYDGFSSWQESRKSPPAAGEKFQQRRRLTEGAVPYATRLITT